MPLSLFRNRTFAVTSAVGFVVGFALFGAITYLPLYLQIVEGLEPDAVRPAADADDGRPARHLDRQRPLISPLRPLQGVPDRRHRGDVRRHAAAHAARGAHGDHDRVARTWSSLGLGLGMVMQVLVLAVQNAVPFRMMGVATTGSTLFRQVGGSIGVSLFGAIFANSLHSNLAAFLPPGARCRRPSAPPSSTSCRRRCTTPTRTRSPPRFTPCSSRLRFSPCSRSRSRGSSARCRCERRRGKRRPASLPEPHPRRPHSRREREAPRLRARRDRRPPRLAALARAEPCERAGRVGREPARSRTEPRRSTTTHSSRKRSASAGSTAASSPSTPSA